MIKMLSKNKEYIYIYSRFQLYLRAHVRIWEKMLLLSILYFIFKSIPSATHTPKIGTSLDSSLIKKQQS